MNEKLQKYKNAWQRQSQAQIETNQLKEKQIMDFISSQSNSIAAGYRRSLVFDMCLKTVLLVSFLLLAYLLNTNSNLVVLNAFLAIATGSMLVLQSKFYREASTTEVRESAIRDFLERNIAYFNRKFTKAIFMVASSSPLVFLSGSMFYFIGIIANRRDRTGEQISTKVFPDAREKSVRRHFRSSRMIASVIQT